MKKIGLCLGLMAVLSLSSCKKEEETTDTIETTTTTNTVETDTVMVKDTASTSVKIDSNGVEVKGGNVKIDTK